MLAVHRRTEDSRYSAADRSLAIDVVKTRIQIDPALAKNSLLTAGRKIVASEGTKGLLTGFGPTAVGYFFQGGAKFAGYEASVSSGETKA